MAAISNCIFEWDRDDYQLLITAKRHELVTAGVHMPTEVAVMKAITREEAERHCRRKTRGVAEMEMLERLLLSFSSATDTLSVPLLKEEMTDIWEEQKRHIKCLQDPPQVQLYTCLLYTSPSPRDATLSRMPSSA